MPIPLSQLTESVKRLKIHKTSLQPLDNSNVIPNIDSLTIVHSNVTMVYKVNSITLDTVDTYLLEVAPSLKKKPTNTSNALTIFIPYTTSKFSTSDYNSLYGNYTENRRSNSLMESTYNTGTLHPTNLSRILQTKAVRADVQDSNYSTVGFANARYFGSRNMSPDFNITTPFTVYGEQLASNFRYTTGLTPVVEQTNPYMLVFDRIQSTYNEYNGGLAAKIAYIVDEDGNTLTPNKGREGFNIITQGFPATAEIDIELSDNTLFGANMAGINGTYDVKFSGEAPSAYLYTHTGSLGGYERLDELVFDDPNPIGPGFISPDLADPDSTTATTTYQRSASPTPAQVKKGYIFTGADLFDNGSAPYDFAFTADGTQKGIFTTEIEVIGEGRASLFSLYDKIEARLIRIDSSNVKHVLDAEIHKFPEKDPESYTFRLQSIPIDIKAGEKVTVELELLEDFSEVTVVPKMFELRSAVPAGEKTVKYFEGSLISLPANSGPGDGVEGSYVDIAVTTSGDGYGAKINAVVDTAGNITTLEVAYRGFNYATGDTVTIPAGSLGGSFSGATVTLQSTNLKSEYYLLYIAANQIALNPATLQKTVGRFYEGPYDADTLDEDKDFDDVIFPLVPQVGDMVRFNNDETTSSKITEIINIPTTNVTITLPYIGPITITIPQTTSYILDKDVTGYDNTSKTGPQNVVFTRMVEEPVLIVDGFKPQGQTSRGLIKPQYMSDKLVNNFSKIVADLKEKNLI